MARTKEQAIHVLSTAIANRIPRPIPLGLVVEMVDAALAVKEREYLARLLSDYSVMELEWVREYAAAETAKPPPAAPKRKPTKREPA